MTEKPWATETMLTSIVIDGKNVHTFITPPYDIRVQTKGNTVRLMLGRKFKVPKRKKYLVAVMATDDPVPCNAGGAVSLGYGRLFFLLRDAKKIGDNTFEGILFKSNDVKFQTHFMSPMR